LTTDRSRERPESLAGLYEIRNDKSRGLRPASDINFSLASYLLFPYTLTIEFNLIFQKELRMAKKPMTKAQIVSHFAEKFELSKKTSGMIIEEMAALAVFETKKTGSFSIPGVGKLVLSKRKARMGRNPATGQKIKIAAKTVVKMRIAKALKEAVAPAKKVKSRKRR
jgi:DNA-binding protein HU-beta